MLGKEAENTNFSLWFDPTGTWTHALLQSLVWPDRDLNPCSTAVFGLTWQGLEPTLYCSLWFDLTGTWTHTLLQSLVWPDRDLNPHSTAVFGLTWQGLEPTLYCTRGEHTNHYITNSLILYSIVQCTTLWKYPLKDNCIVF
jgi:uncharacterized protein Usg